MRKTRKLHKGEKKAPDENPTSSEEIKISKCIRPTEDTGFEDETCTSCSSRSTQSSSSSTVSLAEDIDEDSQPTDLATVIDKYRSNELIGECGLDEPEMKSFIGQESDRAAQISSQASSAGISAQVDLLENLPNGVVMPPRLFYTESGTSAMNPFDEIPWTF